MKTRKELKEEYKRKEFQMGVFQIKNTVNGKVYILSSTDIPSKWNSQKFQLNMGSHPNTELQKEWKFFGEEKFIYEILHELEKKEDERINYIEELAKFEEIILDEIAPYNNRGYNKAPKS